MRKLQQKRRNIMCQSVEEMLRNTILRKGMEGDLKTPWCYKYKLLQLGDET